MMSFVSEQSESYIIIDGAMLPHVGCEKKYSGTFDKGHSE